MRNSKNQQVLLSDVLNADANFLDLEFQLSDKNPLDGTTAYIDNVYMAFCVEEFWPTSVSSESHFLQTYLYPLCELKLSS